MFQTDPSGRNPTTNPQPGVTFQQLQAQGQARPPQPQVSTTMMPNPQVGIGGGGWVDPRMSAPRTQQGGQQVYMGGSPNFNEQTGQRTPAPQQPAQRPGSAPMLYSGGQQPGMAYMAGAPRIPTGPGGMPNLEQGWQQQYGNARQGSFQHGGGASFNPGNYNGPGQLDAYQRSNFQLPQVQGREWFTAPQNGQQVDQRTQREIMESLRNPSRYGSQQAQDTFDVLNRRLTQTGDADLQRINEQMAQRGIFASTTAGGRMGDLATNLNQQRADYATQIATDQARQYASDRGLAIGQAMGFGGQQFGQGLAGFQANQGAGQQHFNQQLGRGQFGLQQNAQNFGQQLAQHGANQQEGMNQYGAGLSNAQFGLQQQGQNYGQLANTFGLNQAAQQQAFQQQIQAMMGLQGFGQQQFNNQLQTAQHNSDQDFRNQQLLLQTLGML